MYSYTHGGDIYSLGKQGILDFSANINPFGAPESVKTAIIESASGCDIYPDPFCTGLREAISILEGIPSSGIFCSNGAADIIYRLAIGIKPKKALLPVPSFLEYEDALRAVDCDIEYYYMNESGGFTIDKGFIAVLRPDIDIVFLCNPNNPTGHVIDNGLLENIIAACEKNGITAVVDECFIDFLEDSGTYTVKKLIKKYKNLIIIKAFTKLYAMAGVRLGYCFSDNSKYIDLLYSSGQPWGVSYMAQQAGVAATGEGEYVKNTLELINKERKRLLKALTELGYTTYNSKANYIFFKANKATDLKERLLSKNILIRSCENYKGLCKGYYRIAVKKPSENDTLIKALKELN